MRLTLRTMLAYLDGVLEPPDAAVLGKKIEESKFATDLVRRIREVVQKPRLGAPRLEGKGMGLDPNTVADYMETMLPPDRVPDFEKVCLESDVHLAEVAACHQILAMVLGQPADINSASRERMYRVGARVAESQTKRGVKAASPVESKSPSAGAASPAAKLAEHRAPADERSPREQPAPRSDKPTHEEKPARGDKGLGNEKDRPREEKPKADEKVTRAARSPRDDKPVREKPEVPDYLRESRRRPIWPLLLTVVFAFLLAGVLLRALGPFNAEHPLARLVNGAPVEVANVNPPDPKIPAPVDGPKKPADKETPAKPPEKPAVENGSSDKPEGDGEKLPAKPIDESLPEEKPAKPAKPNSTVPGVDTGKSEEPAPPIKTPGKVPLDTADPDDLPAKPEKPVKPGKPVEPAPEGDSPDEKPADKPVAGLIVGRFISDQQVLARFDKKSGDWFRLPKEASLTAGDKLLVLPSYRPQISLVAGVQLTVAGESLIELLPPDAAGVAQLRIEYGKVFIVSSGKRGAQIGLDLGKRQGLATFDNVDSALAVDVRNYRYPGDSPDKVNLIAEIFATSGEVNWAESDGGTGVLAAGQIRTYLDAKPGETAALAETPEWVRDKGLKDIERTASQTLAEKLPVDRSLQLSLEERVEPSKEIKVEIRSLAIRSLMCLDVFDPFVTSLSDEKQKSFWYSQYDTAQDALARGPGPAGELKKSLEAMRTDDAASLYRLLIGYSPDELTRSGASSGAAKLIEYLEDESLDVRVLASETLLRITGKTLSYRPEVPLPRRVPPVNRWRQELKAGTLVYKTLPAPLAERKVLPAKTAPKEPTPKEPAPKEPAPADADS